MGLTDIRDEYRCPECDEQACICDFFANAPMAATSPLPSADAFYDDPSMGDQRLPWESEEELAAHEAEFARLVAVVQGRHARGVMLRRAA